MLAVSLFTASCGTAAQAAGSQNTVAPKSLSLSGNLPAGTVHGSYNAVLAVGGGHAPYHFSVKTGALPPGISLDPATGAFSGKPAAAGKYSFEVIVTDSPNLDQGNRMFALNVAGPNGGIVTVSVSPASATVLSNQTQQFTAAVGGTSNSGVTWSTTEGTIDGTGLFTAPTVGVQTSLNVRATSTADPTTTASIAVTVNPANSQALTITTKSLPQGQQGNTYSEAFSATGGTAPYSWSLSAGNPLAGIKMNSNGNFGGMPISAGTFGFTVQVTDAASQTTSGNFSLTVASGGNFDGPAELPRVTVASTMADTPAPGNLIHVGASEDPQAAVDNAKCGDTITLQAGATYSGRLTLRAKGCDDQHWIIIRTSSPDSALPPEGVRLTPCYAGVASLPNRPAYTCSQAQNVMATISRSVRMGSGPITLASGASHYRLVGLEITRPVDKVPVVALIATTQDTPADHIVIDRCWIHGTAQEETRRGIALRGTTYVAIIDSYLNDFHCTSITGTCTDSSDMGGGTGNNASGPWKIEDNFLEAAGENILFGGSAATIVPADITIRHNHFYKVPQWMRGQPGFVGGYGGNPFVVKNLFEIKNGTRILLEGNILEYSWGGFSQNGQSILITPRNDTNARSGETNLCPVCEATDITVRYNKISHTAAGFNISTVKVDNLGGQAAERYSIHDVIVDDINAAKYTGGGGLFLIMNFWPKQTLSNVSIRHITGFPDSVGHVLGISNSMSQPQMYGFTFQDNLVVVPKYPVWSAGAKDDCSSADIPMKVISTCFKTFTFTNNVLAGVTKAFPAATWPTGNFFPATINDMGFVSYNAGIGGDYHLRAGSLYSGKASDGTDPGADIDAVNAATQGVE